MALDDVTRRLERITRVLGSGRGRLCLGWRPGRGLWVATVDPAAVRTTKDVDMLLNRQDLPAARDAAAVGRHGLLRDHGRGHVHRPRGSESSSRRTPGLGGREGPTARTWCPHRSLEDRETLPGGHHVVSLCKTGRDETHRFRDQDRVHLRDLIDVGLHRMTLLRIDCRRNWQSGLGNYEHSETSVGLVLK